MDIRALLGGVVISVAGVATMGLEWRLLREALRSARWPKIVGRVTASEFKSGPLAGRYIRTTTGRAAISYQYELNGRELTGSRVFVGDEEFGSAYDAQRRTRHYYAGVVVDVYYDPADPSRTVLEAGVNWSRAWKFLTGVAMLAFGVAVFLVV